MFVTQAWRSKYDKIFHSALSKHIRQQHDKSGLGGGRDSRPPDKNQVKSLSKQARKLTQFLKTFVAKTNELKWGTRERTFMNRIMEVPPDLSIGGSESVVYPDPAHEWTRCLLYGVESELLLFNILTFAMCDLWFDDSLVSVVLTYLMEQLVVGVRSSFGQKNLAEKTLIDERFLI